jgi:hypothetical protein
MMAKRTDTRAKRVIDIATDEINRVDARRGLAPEERSQEVRRALMLRWARQRRLSSAAYPET